MAAHEYYNPGATVPRPDSHYPPNGYSQTPPPPYSPQPPPQQQQYGFDPKMPHPPPPQTNNYPQQCQQPYYIPQSQPPPQQHYGTPPASASQHFGQYNQPAQYPPPAETGSLRPGSQSGRNNFGQQQVRFSESPQLRPQTQSPYRQSAYAPDSRDLIPAHRSHHSRSRSRDGRERDRSGRRHRSDSDGKSKSRGGKVDTFVGAGGGAIIGDLIFPGLGTVGGALLGGYGGHKVAQEKKRDSRDEADYHRRYDHHERRIGRSRGRDTSESDSEREGRRRH